MLVIASDFDGTIYINHEISAATLDAIKNWQRAGNLFGLVTGRSKEGMAACIQGYEIHFDFLIETNGAVIDGQSVAPLESALVDKILEQDYLNDSWHIVYFAEEATKVQILKDDSWFQKNGGEVNLVDRCPSNMKMNQLSFMFDSFDKAKQATELLNQKFEEVCAHQNNECVDVTASGVNKASSLERWAFGKNIPKQNIYTIGDGHNDLAMLRSFSSASFPYAAEEVQREADRIIPDMQTFMHQLLAETSK